MFTSAKGCICGQKQRVAAENTRGSVRIPDGDTPSVWKRRFSWGTKSLLPGKTGVRQRDARSGNARHRSKAHSTKLQASCCFSSGIK
ncbi:hypothetical protein TNIN_224671 [Trichonephila inaurata madagascariensis]|uniref:Uncharacterized protein n=1 Tax=Trichonephila inaurata madagascariensis TaxID=2747483 RepID=A0A8X7CK05_9ARAC|nr:hypothetical protein TNIN_224671 [Trichonephila inaurata madagascariensis]